MVREKRIVNEKGGITTEFWLEPKIPKNELYDTVNSLLKNNPDYQIIFEGNNKNSALGRLFIYEVNDYDNVKVIVSDIEKLPSIEISGGRGGVYKQTIELSKLLNKQTIELSKLLKEL